MKTVSIHDIKTQLLEVLKGKSDGREGVKGAKMHQGKLLIGHPGIEIWATAGKAYCISMT